MDIFIQQLINGVTLGVKPLVVETEGGRVIEGNGVSGALCLGTPWPGQARTVWGDHHRFKETYFTQYKGYYFTGDGCRRDEDGYYWITGRIDDVLNVSGHRIGTAEVESALVLHDAIAEAAVVGYSMGGRLALHAAAVRGSVLPVFIWSPEEEAPWAPGAASRWWLHNSLASLARSIEDGVKPRQAGERHGAEGRVGNEGAADAVAACDAAAEAFKTWKDTGPGERRMLLLKAADALVVDNFESYTDKAGAEIFSRGIYEAARAKQGRPLSSLAARALIDELVKLDRPTLVLAGGEPTPSTPRPQQNRPMGGGGGAGRGRGPGAPPPPATAGRTRRARRGPRGRGCGAAAPVPRGPREHHVPLLRRGAEARRAHPPGRGRWPRNARLRPS